MKLRTYYTGPFLKRVDKGMVIAYPLSGFITTMVDYAVFGLFFTVFGTGLLVATVIAYIVGLVVSYVQNRFWVFRKSARRQSEAASLWKYATFLVVNLAITYGLLWVMEHTLNISPYIGKFIVNGFMFFWIYVGNTYFVFKGKKVGPIQL